MGYLVTPGGAGTWALARAAGLAIKNNDPNFNSHNRNPFSVSATSQVAYVYANPMDTIISFWRRGFMRDGTHAANLGVKTKLWKGANDIEMWLRVQNEDPFELWPHFLIWANRPNTVVVKYEALQDEKIVLKLADWLKCDLSKFVFKRRMSVWVECSDSVITHLVRLYGAMLYYQYGLPRWFHV